MYIYIYTLICIRRHYMYTHVVRNRNVHPDSSLWHNIQARPRGKIRPRWPVKDMLDTGVQLLVYTWSYTEWGILQFQNSRVPKHVMFVTKVHLPASRASRVGMRGWSKKQLFAHLGAMPDLTLTSWWNSAFREAGWIWLEGGIFFCADCLILVLMYWTIRFFFFCSLDPYSIGTTFQSCNLIWIHQSHIQRTTHVSIKFTVGGWKKTIIREWSKNFVSIDSLGATIFQLIMPARSCRWSLDISWLCNSWSRLSRPFCSLLSAKNCA